ncbi:MAG: histidine kinase [Bacteroidetes bacterium]|nr:histidine kinase [Bacteroidota bacterium]
MSKRFFIPVTMLLLLGAKLRAQDGDTVVIHNMTGADSINLLTHATYYIDKENNLTWPQILKQPFAPFFDTAKRPPDFFHKDISLWLRCTLQNASGDSVPMMLVFDSFSFFREVIVKKKDSLSFYRPNYIFNPHRKITRKSIPVFLAKGEQATVWVCIYDPFSNLVDDNLFFTNTISFNNWLQDTFKSDYAFYIFKIVFLCIVAFITVHTLVQYSIRRRLEFIWYSLYSFFVFLFFLRQLEASSHYDILFTFFPYALKYANNVISILVYYTYFQFARAFVNFQSLAPWYDKLISYLKWLLMMAFVADLSCSFFGYYNLRTSIFTVLRVILLIAAFVGVFLLLRTKKKLLYFFGIGSLFLIVGSLLSMIFTFYPEQSPFFWHDPLRYMQIGIIIELFCFTSGLSYKSSLIEVEKRQTQQQLIGQLEENKRLQEDLNVNLEERVKEQTEQILLQQRQLEKEKEQQLTIEFKKKLTEMELQVLKAQLNPHFYFNTLNNLYGLTIIDPKKAPDAILKLSDIMEYIIYDCKNEKVLLGKELKFISSYIELERLRYENDAHISLNINGGGDGKMIAPLLLIQFVENAFKHGMEHHKTASYMQVDIAIEGNGLFFKSVNSVRQKADSNHGLGLTNVKKRLQMLYPGKHHLMIDRTVSEFIVELHLDL